MGRLITFAVPCKTPGVRSCLVAEAATINMDGTALYEAAAAIFIAQAIGMDMSLLQ